MSEEMPSVIEFSEDVSTAEAPPALPAGEYEAEIRKAEVKVSANSGNRYASVHFMIPPEQYPADYDASAAADGKTIVYNMVTLEDNPTARFRLRKFVESIGAKGGKQIDVNDWIGLTCVLEVQPTEWEGVPREEIRKVKEKA
jgi:hypothetical protein